MSVNRHVERVRREALAAQPPVEKKQFRKSDLIEVTALDPTVKLDIRYATTNNFLSTPFYTSAKAYLQRPAAEALVRAHKKLAKQGYGLLILDVISKGNELPPLSGPNAGVTDLKQFHMRLRAPRDRTRRIDWE